MCDMLLRTEEKVFNFVKEISGTSTAENVLVIITDSSIW
jgi:hypothetical protein